MFEVRRMVSQTRVKSGAPSCSDSRLTWNAELLRLALVRTQSYLRLASNTDLLRPASEVSMLLEMRGPRFSSKRDLRVEMRLASDDLF